MPVIRNPAITMFVGHLGLLKFVQHCKRRRVAVRFSYRKADGTISDYVATTPPKEAVAALALNALTGNTRKPSPNVEMLWIVGKGWRSFKPEGFLAAKSRTILLAHDCPADVAAGYVEAI